MAWEVSFPDLSTWCSLYCIWLGIYFHRLGSFLLWFYWKHCLYPWDGIFPSMSIIYKVGFLTMSQKSLRFCSCFKLLSFILTACSICPQPGSLSSIWSFQFSSFSLRFLFGFIFFHLCFFHIFYNVSVSLLNSIFMSLSCVYFLEFIEEIVHIIFEFFQASISTFFDVFWTYSNHSFGFFVWNFVKITVSGSHLYENVGFWRKHLVLTFPVTSVFPLGFAHLKQLC